MGRFSDFEKQAVMQFCNWLFTPEEAPTNQMESIKPPSANVLPDKRKFNEKPDGPVTKRARQK